MVLRDTQSTLLRYMVVSVGRVSVFLLFGTMAVCSSGSVDLLAKASHLAKSGRSRAAAHYYEAAIKEAREQKDDQRLKKALAGAIEAHFECGAYSRVTWRAEELLQLEPVSAADRKRVEELTTRAAAAFRTLDASNAPDLATDARVAILTAFANENKGRPEAAHLLLTAAARLSWDTERDKMQEIFERVRSQYPGSGHAFEALDRLTMVHLQDGDLAKARRTVELLTRTAKVPEDKVSSCIMLARVLHAQGDTKGALAAIRKARENVREWEPKVDRPRMESHLERLETRLSGQDKE